MPADAASPSTARSREVRGRRTGRQLSAPHDPAGDPHAELLALENNLPVAAAVTERAQLIHPVPGHRCPTSSSESRLIIDQPRMSPVGRGQARRRHHPPVAAARSPSVRVPRGSLVVRGS